MDISNYTLRARVIKGSIIKPDVTEPEYEGLTDDNFEIVAPYNKGNFMRLYEIGKAGWTVGLLTEYEILAWAGGPTDHDGTRFLWSFRPDLYQFESVPAFLDIIFSQAKPRPMSHVLRSRYNKYWLENPFRFTLGEYEVLALGGPKPSLKEQITSARDKAANDYSGSYKASKTHDLRETSNICNSSL